MDGIFTMEDLYQTHITNSYDDFWGLDKNIPKDTEDFKPKLSKPPFSERKMKPDRKKFEEVLKSAFDSAESEEIRRAILAIAELPDERDTDFEFKKYCWNNGRFMAQTQIYDELERMRNEEFRRSGAYKDYMVTGYDLAIFLPMLLPLITFLVLFAIIADEDILFSLLCIPMVIGNPVFLLSLGIGIFIRSIVLHFLAKDKMEYASNYGANYYNDKYYRDARNTQIFADTTAAFTAIAIGRSVHNKLKTETQIKKDF